MQCKDSYKTEEGSVKSKQKRIKKHRAPHIHTRDRLGWFVITLGSSAYKSWGKNGEDLVPSESMRKKTTSVHLWLFFTEVTHK